MEKIFLVVSLPLFKYCNYVLVALHLTFIIHVLMMLSSNLKSLIFITIVTSASCSNLRENLTDEYLKHEIVKRGLGWPWLIYALNAATGN
jgi:hypothetical protein